MVKDVVVEAVGSQNVSPVIGLVNGPVIPQAFGTEHKDAVVAELVILDDGQCLESFAQTDAIGDDTTAEAVELVDGADHTVTLELEEFLPDYRISDSCGGFDNLILVELFAAVLEKVMKYQGVDGEWITMGSQVLE